MLVSEVAGITSVSGNTTYIEREPSENERYLVRTVKREDGLHNTSYVVVQGYVAVHLKKAAEAFQYRRDWLDHYFKDLKKDGALPNGRYELTFATVGTVVAHVYNNRAWNGIYTKQAKSLCLFCL